MFLCLFPGGRQASTAASRKALWQSIQYCMFCGSFTAPLMMEMLQFCKIQQHPSEVPSSSICMGTPSKGALQPGIKHYRHSKDMHLSAFVSVNLPTSTGANLATKFDFKYLGNTACTQQNNYFKQDAISFSCRIFMLLRCFINNRGKIVNKKGLGFSWTHRQFQSRWMLPKMLLYCAFSCHPSKVTDTPQRSVIQASDVMENLCFQRL